VHECVFFFLSVHFEATDACALVTPYKRMMENNGRKGNKSLFVWGGARKIRDNTGLVAL
jgi:hypothetical protein